jgi:glucan phosphoethanolaminetransferase (alkaline phosphatase superfamily)
MIQRIQSVYLFLTTLLAIIFLQGSFFYFTDKAGTTIKVTLNGIEQGSATQGFSVIERLYPLTIAVILIALISLAAIFIYKRRNIQINFVKILIVLIVFLIIACVHSVYRITNQHTMELVPGIKLAFPLLMLVFSILAHRGIKKDDDLVKSYDRLR